MGSEDDEEDHTDHRLFRWELIAETSGPRASVLHSGPLVAQEATLERAKGIFREFWQAGFRRGAVRLVDADGKEIARYTAFDHRRDENAGE
jgi:precorrin-6B methylase 2